MADYLCITCKVFFFFFPQYVYPLNCSPHNPHPSCLVSLKKKKKYPLGGVLFL